MTQASLNLSQPRHGGVDSSVLSSTESQKSPHAKNKKNLAMASFELSTARSRLSSEDGLLNLKELQKMPKKFNHLPVSVISKITRGTPYLHKHSARSDRKQKKNEAIQNNLGLVGRNPLKLADLVESGFDENDNIKVQQSTDLII